MLCAYFSGVGDEVSESGAGDCWVSSCREKDALPD